MAQLVPGGPRGLKVGLPGEKLLVPDCFQNNQLLFQSRHEHTFAGELKSLIDKSPQTEWVTPNTAYTLLANADEFWVDIRDSIHFHGGCAIVKTQTFAQDIKHPTGYSIDITVVTTERQIKRANNKVEPDMDEKDTVVLDRFDTYGEVWYRRRYQLPEDSTYTFVQWMLAREAKLKETPTAIKLSDISCRIDSIDDALKEIRKDVSQIKDLITDFTTVVKANLAQAETIREFVKEQTTAAASTALELAKLREELRVA